MRPLARCYQWMLAHGPGDAARDLAGIVVDITHRLLDGELLRAHHVPAITGSRDAQEEEWRITVHTNGELVGHRSHLSLAEGPSILLPEVDYQLLTHALDRLGIDYEPKSACDDCEYRFLTYLSDSGVRHITYAPEMSQGFRRFDDFDRVWKLLGSFARRVGF